MQRLADKAWQCSEAMIGLGRVGDPARGRQTFQRYVEETWRPNHEVEMTTRERYTCSLHLAHHAGVRAGCCQRRVNFVSGKFLVAVVTTQAAGPLPAWARDIELPY